MQARFAETKVLVILDEKAEARGTVLLQVPGRFRWNYEAPQESVTLVKDGRFSRYLPRAKQVFRGQAKGEADLLVGFGPGAAGLGKKYQVTLAGGGGGGQALPPGCSTCKPQAAQASSALFSAIRLWVDKARHIPVQTRLTEPTGDHTTVRFEEREAERDAARGRLRPHAAERRGRGQVSRKLRLPGRLRQGPAHLVLVAGDAALRLLLRLLRAPRGGGLRGAGPRGHPPRLRASSAPRGALMVSLSGGDPLLREDLPEVVARGGRATFPARHHPRLPRDTRSGRARCGRAACEAATVTLDHADAARQDAAAGMPGSHARALPALAAFAATRTRCRQQVNVKTTLRAGTLEGLEELLKLGRRCTAPP